MLALSSNLAIHKYKNEKVETPNSNGFCVCVRARASNEQETELTAGAGAFPRPRGLRRAGRSRGAAPSAARGPAGNQKAALVSDGHTGLAPAPRTALPRRVAVRAGRRGALGLGCKGLEGENLGGVSEQNGEPRRAEGPTASGGAGGG